MMGFLFHITPTKEIVLAGDKEDVQIKRMLDKINGTYLSFTTVILNDNKSQIYGIAPFVEKQGMIED